MCVRLADCWLWYMCMCMISWMIRPPCEITDQLAVGTQNCFSNLFYMPYTNIKTSAQNATKCTIARQKSRKFSGGGYPLPKPYPLGAFGASILVPLSLGVSVPLHLRLEHCVVVTGRLHFSLSHDVWATCIFLILNKPSFMSASVAWLSR